MSNLLKLYARYMYLANSTNLPKVQIYGHRSGKSTDMLYATVFSTMQFVLMCWRVPEQSQAKNLPYFLATLPLYRSRSVFSSIIEPVSTIADPDVQSSA